MKKILILTFTLIFSLSAFSQHNNSYSHQGYYFSNNESIYWVDDFNSANIIVSNIDHYDLIVKNLMDIFSNPSDLVYYDNDDDNIIIYSNDLPSFDKDSLISIISVDTNDIAFFTYSKIVNNSHIWLRNEVLIRFKHPVLQATLEQQLSDFENIQILNESNNKYSIICKNEQDVVEISNILYDTSQVFYSCPDFYGTGSLNTNDTYYPEQWGLNNTGNPGITNVDINAPEAWGFLNALGLNFGGNIKIAIIDDGVEHHEDLLQNGISKVLEGYTANGVGTGLPCSDCKHGMGSAGIIAATHNDIGVAGVSPNVEIVPIRIFKSDNLFFAFFNNRPMFRNKHIAEAINKSWEEFGCSILSNSWSQNYHHDVIKFAIKDALEDGRNGLGCIWVNSSGNDNRNSINFPARYYDKIIAVGAINKYGERGRYDSHSDPWDKDGSNYGEKLDIVAPGTKIATIDREGNHGYNNTNYDLNAYGTSVACPFVSGVAALILTINPNLTNQQVNNIIESTAKKVGLFDYQNTPGRNNGTWHEEVGYGLVDAYSAVKKTVFGNGGTIIGNSCIDVCELKSYEYQGQELPSSIVIIWETSPNFTIISGQGTNNITIGVVSTNETNPYIKIKFYSNNVLLHSLLKQITITGDLIYPSVALENTTINQNIVWSNEGFLGVNITIEDNATLTVSNKLHISNNAKVIVKPGGKLIINGGTLTNYCSNTPWQGIIVEGNSTQSQMGANANQGIVVFNGATIENAICGIKVGDLSDPSKSGGIVYATNSTFKNCMNSVIFRPYENMNGNIEFANRSKFTNCNFVIDTNFNSTGLVFDTHVKLFGVNGISFTGCSFTDTQTNPNPPINQYSSSGIFAKNSGFSVQPKCFSNVASGEVCASPYVDVPSIFSGLRYGIVILNSGTMKQVKISSTQFTNNDCGVFVSGLHNVKLLNNDFVIGKNNSSLISYPVGADFEYASNFRIEENRFLKNSTFLGSAYGLKIKASGVDNNMVYKNKFIDLDNAQIFVGHNYYQPNPFNGLKSICNEHTNNTFDDIMVTIDPNSVVNGINMYQNMEYIVNGVSQTVAAGNIFTLPNSINMQYINNANYLFYYFNPNNSNEVLTNYTTATIGTVTAPENPCPSKIFGLYPQIIDAELASITLDYANLRYNYNQLIDAGNTPEMLQLIQGEWSDDVWKLRNELIAKSPYLSQDVLLTVAMENLLPPALLLEVCLANPDATKSEEFLDKLRYEIPNPLPEYMINLIKSSWDEKTLRTEMEEELSAFKTYRDEYHNYKTELLLSDTVYNYTNIINHLESRGSYSDYFSLAEIAISQNNFTQADIYLDILENSTEKFTEEEILEIASFREYISIRESIALNNKTIYNLDSLQIATLETYAYSNNYRGAILARNILCALYDICIDDIPAPPRSLRVGSNEGNNHNNIPFIASVKVMPNPASEYAAFIWDMKSFDKSSVLYIYDQNGKIIVTQPIHTQQGEWVWNVKNIPDGVYVYTFKSDQLVLFSGKLMINK